MPTVRDVLICDEVRDEVNGKKIFIGVYGDDLVLSDIPAQISKLTFVITIAGLPKGQCPIKFIFESPSGRELISAQSNVNVQDSTKVARLVLSIPNPLFLEPGDFRVKIGFGNSRPQLCHTLTVKKAGLSIAPSKQHKSSRSTPKKRSGKGRKS